MLGQTIQIITSPELLEWKLGKLVGRTGVIVAIEPHRKTKGYWVALDNPYANESEWFIPLQSLQILTNTHGANR